MKLTNLIWVLALAGAVMACNTGPPTTNVRPTGGSTGNGGSGGVGVDACINDADEAVYADLTYTDPGGVVSNGSEASSAIGSDCIFGTANLDPTSIPPLEGCSDEAGAVIRCFIAGCPQETILALGECVAMCTQDATAEIAPPGLSTECMACTGATVACGAAFCTNVCSSDTNAPDCISCRCDNGCTPNFDTCSGLPSSGDCG